MSGYRPPYTHMEEGKILKYIVDERAHYRLRGDAFWKELAEAGIVERTWHSLKNHFKKKLVHKIHNPVYGLEQDDVEAIRMAYNDTKKPVRHATMNCGDIEGNEESEQATASVQRQKDSKKKATHPKPLDFFTMKWSDEEDNNA